MSLFRFYQVMVLVHSLIEDLQSIGADEQITAKMKLSLEKVVTDYLNELQLNMYVYLLSILHYTEF